MDDEKPVLLIDLEAQLGKSYDRIESARAEGLDVTRWEDFWLDLLRQYDRAYTLLHERDDPLPGADGGSAGTGVGR